MPKKRRNPAALSPVRPPGLGPPPGISTAAAAAAPVTATDDQAPASVPTRASGSGSVAASAVAVGAGVNKEELLDRMTEMFSHLDPSVVYVVLSECDFKADDAMDSLLVLSDAAEGVASSSFSGFECVAAALSDNQVSNVSKVVMKDLRSNSFAVSESIRASGLDLTEKLDSSIQTELEKYCKNTYETGPEQCMSYQPFMNQYNSPISQFSRLCVGDQLPELIQSNLNSTLSGMSHQQQTGADDGVSLRHSPFTLNSKDYEENLSRCFDSENSIFEKRSEVQSNYSKFSLEAVEKPSNKKSSIESGVAKIVFPSAIRTSGADIWTNQSESNSLSAAISMNLGTIGSNTYGDSELASQKYDLHPNTVDQRPGLSQSSSISDKVVGEFSGTGGNEISWFRPNKNPSSSENCELFQEPQEYKGTNELKPKSSTPSTKPSANKGSISNNIQQNTTCFPYWFDVGQDTSGEKLPKLMNSGEANYPQYSNSVLFTNISNVSPISWNPWAPEFQPMAKTFITPVAMSPVKPRPGVASSWRSAGAVHSRDPPHLAMRLGANNLHSKPWLNQYGIQQLQTYDYPFPQHMNRKTLGPARVLFLMRGLPGSGKSTLARMLVQQGPNGMIFSTDEYFCQNGHGQFDPSLIGEAHEWNQKRAKEAMEKGYSPVIIDNTNTQAWEMKPYIAMAFKHNYKVVFREPDTWWKFKPRELERRNIHGVSKEKIKAILEHYERHVTVSTIMMSSQPIFPETKAVEPTESAVIGAMNAHVNPVAVAAGPAASPDRHGLSCSLMPLLTCTEDPSTIETHAASSDNLEECIWPPADFPSENRKCGTGHDTGSSTSYSEFINRENIQKIDQTVGSGASSYNSASQSEIEDEKRKVINERTVESEVEVIENTDQLKCYGDNLTHCDNLPTAFSTSIGQRIRRGKRQSADSANNVLEKEGAPKLPIGDLSGESTLIINESQTVERSNQNIELEFLNFVGDWPAAETLKPQDQRKRRTRKTSEQNIRNKDNLNQSDNFESVIQSDSIKEAAGNLVEQKNVEISHGSNSSEASVDSFDDLYVTSSTAENSILERNSENCEELKSPETFEEQISEALSEKRAHKKSWQNRRVGKTCKLALTFTGSSPIAAEFLEPNPLTSAPMGNSPIIPDNSGQENSTQTAPEDFALLWRIEKQKASFIEFKILSGTVDGFKLTDLDATQKSVNPKQSVPYRVVHDKSTYVDENVFVNKEENLQILSDCFKSVPFEDLNDLYEKCNKDVEWATNLLLDSDVKLSNDDSVNKQSVADHGLASSSIAQMNQMPQTEKIDLENVTHNQSSSDTVKISAQKKNGNEVKIIEAGNTNQDGLGLYSDPLHIQSLELCLPPELALQLYDLFGSVGLDPDFLTPEECVVQIDLNLAKIIHQKWKETILERQKQESLSYQLLLEGGNFSEKLKWELEGEVEEEEEDVSSLKYDNKQPKKKDGKEAIPLSAALTAKTDVVEGFPFMDHWSARVPRVSLRDIMSEEMDFQIKQDQSIMKSFLSTKDCATKLKEKRLLKMFPGIDEHFIMDMYKDNNYSFEQTEQFLKSIFDCDLESTKTINIHESVQQNESIVDTNKDKVMLNKDIKELESEHAFQDVEYSDYEDFRAEAVLHRRKQQEFFSKAAEAHLRGMKVVATFYAQQGHLHGEKMKEANHRAAVRILKRVNVSLLPQNVLDLHGLHVDEALYHLDKVLLEKINEYQQKGGKPYLSVITGRGSHSQGGIARIKPAVIDYLKSHNCRFTEPQQGVVKIRLK
uniref:NEDD4-binding protein 2 isoform X3 n=1 Tax=Pristiophorus japonicus TaxID=55135 RepID=UPI00398EF7F9